MDKTDFTTGKIYQKIVDQERTTPIETDEMTITYGVSQDVNLHRLLNNLFDLISDLSITVKKLEFGYELTITSKLV
jgi:TPP-dependent 2-oxoacid decarboxylase